MTSKTRVPPGGTAKSEPQKDKATRKVSKTEARSAVAKFQRYMGVALLASAFFGIYLLATDKSLWILAVSHAYGLLLIVVVDFVLAILIFSSVRQIYLLGIAWAILTIILQVGDIVTAPQYGMTVQHFASYLFTLWAFDAILAAQVVLIVVGLYGRDYLKYKVQKKAVTYFEMGSKNSRRDFLQIVGSIAVLAAIAGAFGVAEVLSPKPQPQSTTQTATGSTNNLPSGAIANVAQLQVMSPVYFDFPSGYPNVLFKKADGTVAALSTLCTHICCQCSFDSGSGDLFCPCHGSVFDDAGNVLRGPAPTPLPSIELSIDSTGNIFPKAVKGSSPCGA